ncbi:hypothetical protein Q5E84_00825 [Providencia sp. CRE-138-0026]|nr:hypothetical protein [Providencia sp. CRE-138-0026]MDO7829455.1 hypothetical protein [Providencia sp. CRE-138-0026]
MSTPRWRAARDKLSNTVSPGSICHWRNALAAAASVTCQRTVTPNGLHKSLAIVSRVTLRHWPLPCTAAQSTKSPVLSRPANVIVRSSLLMLTSTEST